MVHFVLMVAIVFCLGFNRIKVSSFESMGKPTSVKDVDQHEIVRQIAMFLKKSGKVNKRYYYYYMRI